MTSSTMITPQPDIARIAEQNDAFRKFACLGVVPERLTNGRLVVTPSIIAAGDGFVPEAMEAVGHFDTFEPDNDPDGRHDFGAVEIRGQKVFWKLDLYEAGSGFRFGAETPDDPATTDRVLTIMLASDW